MWCIIIQTATGVVIRETVEQAPDRRELNYWEEFYKDTCNFSSPRKATVINVFKIAL